MVGIPSCLRLSRRSPFLAIQGLPPEILSSIFLSLLPIPTYSDQYPSREDVRHEVQKTLLLVCRRWNQVTVGTPTLWTYIRLNLNSTPDEMVKKLRLSGSCPLDVRIGLDSTGAKPLQVTNRFQVVYNILIQSVDRWRSFVFDGLALCPEDISPFIPPLLPNVVEAGYHVCLRHGSEGTAMPDEDDEQTEDPPFKSWPIAPKLRRFATTAAGQFHFEGCPLVAEYSVADYSSLWGDVNRTGRSWEERWKRYILYISTTCPVIETLEVVLFGGGSEYGGVDAIPRGQDQWIQQEEWAILPKLRQLRIEDVGSATLISFLTRINAPELREVRIGYLRGAFPMPSFEFTLSTPPSCKLRFERTPIQAIKLFLSHIRGLDQLTVAIEMVYALQLPGCQSLGRLPYQVPNDEDERKLMDSLAFKWVDDHVRSLELVATAPWGGAKEMLKMQVGEMMTLAHRHETRVMGSEKGRGLLSFWPFNR